MQHTLFYPPALHTSATHYILSACTTITQHTMFYPPVLHTSATYFCYPPALQSLNTYYVS